MTTDQMIDLAACAVILSMTVGVCLLLMVRN